MSVAIVAAVTEGEDGTTVGVVRRLTTAALLACTPLAAACSNNPATADPPASETPSTTTSSTPATTPTPTQSPTSSDPKAKAVAAAKARYLSAVAGRAKAVQAPKKATEGALIASGNADPWLSRILATVVLYRDNGYYQTGAAKVTSMRDTKVVLTGEQPEVQLDVCADNRSVEVRKVGSNEIAPRAPGDKLHPRFVATLRYTSAKDHPTKNWYVVANKVVGSC